MMAMLVAGQASSLGKHDLPWVFVDIGFSAKNSCGVAVQNHPGRNLNFSSTANLLCEIAAKGRFRLLAEAPLSVAFDVNGNPTPRSCETNQERTRAWYVQGGAVVALSVMHLLRRVIDVHPNAEIELFEGFVSFKSSNRDSKKSHAADAELLRSVAMGSLPTSDFQVFEAHSLLRSPSDRIESAFKVMGIDAGIPPVLRAFH